MKSKIKYLVLFLTLFISFTSFNKVNALELNSEEMNKTLILLANLFERPTKGENKEETDTGGGYENTGEPITSEFCMKTRQIWYIFGIIIRVIYILTPILLIVTGSISMAKALTFQDAKKIKDAQGHLIKRVIAAVIIFLIVPLTSMVVDLVAGDSWKLCAKCAFNPSYGLCQIDRVPTGE